MTTITKHVVALVLTLTFGVIVAQEKQTDSVVNQTAVAKKAQLERLEASKKQIENNERELLKKEVEAINKRLDAKEITLEEAQVLKEEAAKKRAANIQDRIAIIDNEIAIINRNDWKEIEKDTLSFGIFTVIKPNSKTKPKVYDLRTSSGVVFAIGFNGAVIEGQGLNDSPYKLGGSGFVELGYAWKTRVFENTNFLRVKYGVSLQWNKLNIKDNQFFVNNGGDISLETFPDNADKIKFRTTNLVFPVHFEFGPSKKVERDDYFRYSTYKQFKFGIGGYGGFNIRTLQKIKYENANGDNVKDKFRNQYNTTDLVYGISSYVAFGGTALYVKYDLNPIFNNQAVNQNNISVGLRFDMD
jgi:hypothetical protein